MLISTEKLMVNHICIIVTLVAAFYLLSSPLIDVFDIDALDVVRHKKLVELDVASALATI